MPITIACKKLRQESFKILDSVGLWKEGKEKREKKRRGKKRKRREVIRGGERKGEVERNGERSVLKQC